MRIGLSGREVPVTKCHYAGEDTNRDGRLDVVCHVPKSALRSAGVTSAVTTLSIRGMRQNGVDVFSQDEVKIIR